MWQESVGTSKESVVAPVVIADLSPRFERSGGCLGIVSVSMRVSEVPYSNLYHESGYFL